MLKTRLTILLLSLFVLASRLFMPFATRLVSAVKAVSVGVRSVRLRWRRRRLRQRHLRRGFLPFRTGPPILGVLALLCLPLVAQAQTWQPLVDDTFSRADTSVGSALNITSAGNNWIDVHGGVANISNNVLRVIANTQTGTFSTNYNVLRPQVEATVDQRILLKTNGVSDGFMAWGAVLRAQSNNTDYYAMWVGQATIRIYRVVGNTPTQIATSSTNPQVLTNHQYTLDFSATGSGASVALAVTVNDLTASSTYGTLSFSDSNAARIVAAGVPGTFCQFLSAAHAMGFVEATTYYNNAKGLTPTPTKAQTSVNKIFAVLGLSTTWNTNTPTWSVVNSTGGSIVSSSVTNDTHATVTVAPGSVGGSIFLKDTVSGAYGYISVEAPSLFFRPAYALVGATGSVLTVTGNTQTWQSVGAPSFGVSGGTGAAITATSVTDDTHCLITLTPGSATGTLTITDATSGASQTLPVYQSLLVGDSHLYFAPGIWDVNGQYATAINQGAYFYAGFTGTSVQLSVDVSPITNGFYPTIRYSVDNAPFTDVTLNNLSSLVSMGSGLAAGSHTLAFYLVYNNPAGRWNHINVLKMNGLVIDSGASGAAYQTIRPKIAYFYGDSILDGYSFNYGTGTGITDPLKSWGSIIAAGLGAEYANIGCSGQGWMQTAFSGDTPILSSSWSYYSNGRSRLVSGLYSPQPDYIFVSEGVNDNGFATNQVQPNVLSMLQGVRAAAPNAYIFLVVSFSGLFQSAMSGAWTQFQNATFDAKVVLIDGGSTVSQGLNRTTANLYSGDGIHPYDFREAQIANIILQKATNVMSHAGRRP